MKAVGEGRVEILKPRIFTLELNTGANSLKFAYFTVF